MSRKQKYRVFVEDVGPGKYSGLHDVIAESSLAACRQVKRGPGLSLSMLLALPHSRRDLWPDDTGAVPTAALAFK